MKVLIVEDEPLAAKRLKRLLKEVVPQAEIMAVLDTLSETIPWLQQHRPDLIFLDIHLADGNSFSIFEQVEVSSPIIFATAYDQYAIRAFKHNSIDYLLKPIEKEDLELSIQKFEQVSTKDQSIDIQSLIKSINQPKPTYQKRFIITIGEKIKSVPIKDIAYFFGQKKFVFLITQDNRRHIVDYTLTQLEDLLDPEHFFRINRQFIVHFPAIKQMYAYSKSRIKIDLSPTPDMEAIVSIDRSRDFKAWLNQ